MLNTASHPDYMQTAVLNEDPNGVATYAPLTVTSWDSASETLTISSHGFTSSDVGKIVILALTDIAYDVTGIAYGYISSIPDGNTIILTNGFEDDEPGTNGLHIYALVGEAYSYTNNKLECSISSLNIDRIIKIVDSVNGLVVNAGDLEIEGITYFSVDKPGNSLKQKDMFYTVNGETISIYKGTSIDNPGTLTMYYYRQPNLVVNSTDYIDVKDKYMSLVISKAKNLLYEQLQTNPPESLTNLIEQKSAIIRANNNEEIKIIKDNQKKKQ